MKILVTGASGFLGRNLTKALVAAGHELVTPASREIDLTKQGSLAALSSQRFDQIWHLAAWTQAGDFCLRFPGDQWVKNQAMNTEVLTWWQACQPQAKLITMGTSCAYSPDLPLREEFYHDGRPIDSLFTYALTKRMMQAGLAALGRQYGLRHLTLVPSTLYGPGYHTDGRQLHFIFDLIRKIQRGRRDGSPVVLWGDGYQRRELIHVDDFVSAALWLANRAENDIVNIGYGSEHSIRDFAGLICRHVGYPEDRIEYDTTKYVGAKSKCLEIGKLRALKPDFSPRALEVGLPPVIDWMAENHS